MPSTLPASSTGTPASAAEEKTKYVVSPSGHAAHPDDIIASCKALQAYMQRVQDDADRELKAWQDAIDARELAEKRRVAPGWLDSDARILEPERRNLSNEASGGPEMTQKHLMDADVSSQDASSLQRTPVAAPSREGDELDRAFGGLGINNS
jgi:hypothetical protein